MKKYNFFALALSVALSFLFCCCMSLSSTSSGSAYLPDSMFNPIQAENAQLRIRQAAVRSFDGIKTNWGEGSIVMIPAGLHTVVITATRDPSSPQVPLSFNFLPGKCYIIGYDLETERTGGGGGYTEILTGTAHLRGYGSTDFAVPKRNESLLEIQINTQNTNESTSVSVNGNSYMLSTFKWNANEKLRMVLPAGTYSISSLATVNSINLEIPPNRHIVLAVDFTDVTIKKISDQPLGYIGKWQTDLGGGNRFVLTLNTDGMGANAMYSGGTLMDGSGMFSYTATDKVITIKLPGEPDRTVPYQVSSDQNTISLNNFFGANMVLTKAR